MSISKPYASLCRTQGVSSTGRYYIRFSAACAPLFDGAERCYCLKTKDNKYIVIRPITKLGIERKPTQLKISRTGSGITLSVTSRVREGFFSRLWFTGERYKVKKDREGRVFICLEDKVKEEQP